MPEMTFSVSELNEYVRGKLHMDPLLKLVTVKGEISDYKQQTVSGHAYFTLKDENAVISCTMWRSNVQLLRFVPRAGKKVRVKGQVTLYVAGGKYQLVADSMTEEGQGDLFARFEELKNRLQAEGLFDSAIKKPLPLMVKTIGVATSLSGAAVRDIIKVSRGRNPNIDIIIAPCAVQGKGAENEIAAAIDALDKDGRAEVILVGRGGGSMEDLWAFNEEAVARAIYRCSKPVISCVGHETDFSIADFVADVRASTPSNAAELAVADVKELSRHLDNLHKRLNASMKSAQAARWLRLNNLIKSRALSNPRAVFIDDRQKHIDDVLNRLKQSESKRLNDNNTRVDNLLRLLESLNPANIKKRGYAVVRRNGAIISDAMSVTAGDMISVELMQGALDASVTEVRGTENG